MNTSIAKTTNKTPYEVVFGQRPRSDFEIWKIITESGVEDEEDLPSDIMNQLNNESMFCIVLVVDRKKN